MISWPNSLPLPLPKWHSEPGEEAARLVVRTGGGDDADLQPAKLVDLVVVDLGDDALLAKTERVVATAVESVRADATEGVEDGRVAVRQLVQHLSTSAT